MQFPQSRDESLSFPSARICCYTGASAICVKIKQRSRECPFVMSFKVRIIHCLSNIRANYLPGHASCGWGWQARGWRGVLHSYQGVMSRQIFGLTSCKYSAVNCIEMIRIWPKHFIQDITLSECSLHGLWRWLHQGLEPGAGAAEHVARAPVGGAWPGGGRGQWHALLLLHGRRDQELERGQPGPASRTRHGHSDGDTHLAARKKL